MSSGNSSLKFNTRERVISTDQNRAQKFRDAYIAQVLRALVDTSHGTDDLDAAALNVPYSTLDTPVRAEILRGLCALPQTGSTSILVSEGEAYFVSPDAEADDSVLKYVADPGVSTLGALVVAANASGSIRIDLIECQWAISTSETDTRDIYDPATETFSPALVTKVQKGALTYRVRQGTPGAGAPALASGWLPLAVASVPNGSTNNDTVTFWDVRPLIADRAFGTFNLQRDKVSRGPCLAWASSIDGSYLLRGEVDAVFGDRRIGGRIRSGGAVSVDADSLDFTAAANQEPAVAFTSGQPWYVYFAFPLGLPRWARYTATGARLPRSPRGIPIVTNKAPTAKGLPASAISLPTSTGLGGSTSNAVALLGGLASNVAPPTQNLLGFYVDGSETRFENGLPNVAAGATLTNSYAEFTLTDGAAGQLPACASKVLLEFEVTLTSAGAGTALCADNVQLYLPNNGVTLWQSMQPLSRTVRFESASAFTYRFQCWVPLPTMYPTNSTTPVSRKIRWTFNPTGTVATASAFVCRIVGWELR